MRTRGILVVLAIGDTICIRHPARDIQGKWTTDNPVILISTILIMKCAYQEAWKGFDSSGVYRKRSPPASSLFSRDTSPINLQGVEAQFYLSFQSTKGVVLYTTPRKWRVKNKNSSLPINN
jgi:hypothetical protein